MSSYFCCSRTNLQVFLVTGEMTEHPDPVPRGRLEGGVGEVGISYNPEPYLKDLDGEKVFNESLPRFGSGPSPPVWSSWSYT